MNNIKEFLIQSQGLWEIPSSNLSKNRVLQRNIQSEYIDVKKSMRYQRHAIKYQVLIACNQVGGFKSIHRFSLYLGFPFQ